MSYICSTCFKNHNHVILFRNRSLFLHLSMSNVMALEETEKKHILIHSHQLFICYRDIHHNCPFTTKPVSITGAFSHLHQISSASEMKHSKDVSTIWPIICNIQQSSRLTLGHQSSFLWHEISVNRWRWWQIKLRCRLELFYSDTAFLNSYLMFYL